MSKILAIKGDEERGNEVIALLEMLGGDNKEHCQGIELGAYYYIDIRGCITYEDCFVEDELEIFTLDEFYKKYPFKVGDKVIDKADGCPGVVCEMKWDEDVSDMKYCVAFGNGIDFGWFANDSIEFCKENENLGETSVRDRDDILFDSIIWHLRNSVNNGKQYLSGGECETYFRELVKKVKENDMETEVESSLTVSKDMINTRRLEIDLNEYEYNIENNKLIIQKKLLYPKTYRECFYTLYGHENDAFNLSGVTDEEYDLFGNLIKLKRCRDAYWKIAGEQMGLGKPWDSTYGCGEWGYWFGYDINENKIYLQDSRILVNHTLVFPTEEMRDAFYENFKDLIEQCKELL